MVVFFLLILHNSLRMLPIDGFYRSTSRLGKLYHLIVSWDGNRHENLWTEGGEGERFKTQRVTLVSRFVFSREGSLLEAGARKQTARIFF